MANRLPVLPSDPPARKIRPSRHSKWRAASLIAVHVLIAAHIAHWFLAGSTVTPVEPSEAMAFSKGGVVNAGLIFFAAAILLTALFGRWFCGWACHLVALQDLSRWLLEKVGLRPQPLRSRLLAWVPALAFAYMFLWPAAYRLWIGDALGVTGWELTTQHFWETFPGWVIGALTFVVCGFACVWFLGAKGFCTYACPYGAIFSAADRLAPLRIRVTDACSGCGHCTAVCTSNVRVHEEVRDYGMVVDSGCMKCTDCVSVCPNDALYVGFGRLPVGAPRRTPPAAPRRPSLTWPEEITAALAFLAGFLAFRGLYGQVPFLMSLGVAGVLAFVALLALRLFRRPDFAWRHWRLRAGGRLTPAGRRLLAVAAAVFVLWSYSAALRAQAALAERDFRATARARTEALDAAAPRPALTAEEREVVERGRSRWRGVERWGLLPWRGAAAQRAALADLAGDRADFERQAARAVERREAPMELFRLQSRQFAEAGNLAAALAAGERAIALAPGRPDGYASLGILLARAGALDAAAEVLQRGIRHFPRSTELVYDAAIVSAYRGDQEAAIAGFRAVLAIDPEHREARENLEGLLDALTAER